MKFQVAYFDLIIQLIFYLYIYLFIKSIPLSRLSTPRTKSLSTHQFDKNQTDELNKHEQFSTLFCSDEKSSEQSKAENI